MTARLALVALASLALATGPAAAQSIWDDPAFQLLRQATDALNASDFPKAQDLATKAIAEMPSHPLAY